MLWLRYDSVNDWSDKCGGKQEESSTISSWKEEAVITPTEGKLVGAGYINVKVNTSVTDAESYNIVFDGKKAVELEANGENEQMAEVYTTSIAKHTLKVEAVLASGETVESNERNFFVSKKGIALGEDMSKTVELKKMNFIMVLQLAGNTL